MNAKFQQGFAALSCEISTPGSYNLQYKLSLHASMSEWGAQDEAVDEEDEELEVDDDVPSTSLLS